MESPLLSFFDLIFVNVIKALDLARNVTKLFFFHCPPPLCKIITWAWLLPWPYPLLSSLTMMQQLKESVVFKSETLLNRRLFRDVKYFKAASMGGPTSPAGHPHCRIWLSDSSPCIFCFSIAISICYWANYLFKPRWNYFGRPVNAGLNGIELTSSRNKKLSNHWQTARRV